MRSGLLWLVVALAASPAAAGDVDERCAARYQEAVAWYEEGAVSREEHLAAARAMEEAHRCLSSPSSKEAAWLAEQQVIMLRGAGEYERAMTRGEQLVQTLHAASDPDSIGRYLAVLYRELAILYHFYENPSKEYYAIQLSLHYARPDELPIDQYAMVYANAATFYAGIGEFTQAEHVLQTAYDAMPDESDATLAGRDALALLNYGTAALVLRQFPDSRARLPSVVLPLEICRSLYDEIGEHDKALACTIALGEAFVYLGQKGRGTALIDSAATVAARLDDPFLQQEAAAARARIQAQAREAPPGPPAGIDARLVAGLVLLVAGMAAAAVVVAHRRRPRGVPPAPPRERDLVA